MLVAHCDIDGCENTILVKTAHVTPKGWFDLTISGIAPSTAKYMSQRYSIKRIVCADCVSKIFDMSAKPKMSMAEQFEAVASDYLNELAVEQLEQAAENL